MTYIIHQNKKDNKIKEINLNIQDDDIDEEIDNLSPVDKDHIINLLKMRHTRI